MPHTFGDQRICFVGDSFVQGTGDPLCLGWAGRLAQHAVEHGVNLTHYNLGIRRDTSRDISARWQHECAARLPTDCTQRVVFSFGVNDTSYYQNTLRVTPGESVTNFQEILRAATARYHVLMIGPPPMPDEAHTNRIARLDRQYEDVAGVLNIPYLSIWEQLRDDPHWLQEARDNDGAHPGKKGYDALAKIVLQWENWWFR